MNIYDIAKEAGVSIATVSRVLNNKGTVSAATRARVEAILKQNNYTPSAIARGMVSKSMRTVAVLTVDIRVPHYARTAYTIEREFSRRGYEVILCNTGGDRAETLRYLQAVNQKQVDGIVLVGSVFDTICQGTEMEKLLTGVPVVLANGKLDLPNAYSVTASRWRWSISLRVDARISTTSRTATRTVPSPSATAFWKPCAAMGWNLPTTCWKQARRWHPAWRRCRRCWRRASCRTVSSAAKT